jgi:hypothetical protein
MVQKTTFLFLDDVVRIDILFFCFRLHHLSLDAVSQLVYYSLQRRGSGLSCHDIQLFVVAITVRHVTGG